MVWTLPSLHAATGLYPTSYFDQMLTMASFINYKIKVASYHLRRIGSIRKYITTGICHRLVCVPVIPNIDYCNGLLDGLAATMCTVFSGSRTVQQGWYHAGTRAPELLNKFPLNIRTIRTLQSFKQTLKIHIFQSAYRLH